TMVAATSTTPTPDVAKAAADAAASASATATPDAAEAAKAAAADIALALPKDSLIPATHVDEVKAFAKEHNISAKAAQAILDRTNSAVAADRQAEAAAYTAMVSKWEGESRADKEMGGDSYAANAQLMERALDSFASDQFKKDLEASGLIHQPEFRRFLLRVGKASSEDGLSAARTSTSANAQQQSEDAALRARYPKMYENAAG
ncbi:MAG: hypothetical protein RIQ79_2404, partial [Verrucomicrobiota bacterium]